MDLLVIFTQLDPIASTGSQASSANKPVAVRIDCTLYMLSLKVVFINSWPPPSGTVIPTATD